MNMKPNKKWVPKEGQIIWYVDWKDTFQDHSKMVVYDAVFYNVNGHKAWYIPTKREAQEAARKINSILKGEG